MVVIFNIQIDEYKNLSEVVKTKWCSSQTVTWASVARSRRGGLRFFLVIILSMYTQGPLAIESKKMKCHLPTSTVPFCGKIIIQEGLRKKWPHALLSAFGSLTAGPIYVGAPNQRLGRTQPRFASYLHARANLLHQFDGCRKF